MKASGSMVLCPSSPSDSFFGIRLLRNPTINARISLVRGRKEKMIPFGYFNLVTIHCRLGVLCIRSGYSAFYTTIWNTTTYTTDQPSIFPALSNSVEISGSAKVGQKPCAVSVLFFALSKSNRQVDQIGSTFPSSSLEHDVVYCSSL